jgi:hypothetical protein
MGALYFQGIHLHFYAIDILLEDPLSSSRAY